MRGYVNLIEQKYGQNTANIFRKLEKMEVKISNFKNHLRFLLRCLNKGLVPVSVRLKNMWRARKGKDIIYKIERKLFNKRIWNISGTIQCYEQERYMYQHDLKELIDEEMWTSFMAEINKVKELRHETGKKRQISKFNNLLQWKKCKKSKPRWQSNQDGPEMTNITPKKLVINLSSTLPTQEQESLLAHGQNFVWPLIDHFMGST